MNIGIAGSAVNALGEIFHLPDRMAGKLTACMMVAKTSYLCAVRDSHDVRRADRDTLGRKGPPSASITRIRPRLRRAVQYLGKGAALELEAVGQGQDREVGALRRSAEQEGSAWNGHC
jgi:hypothetical protein